MFKSVKQEHYLFAKQPAVAKEFASKTPKGAKLPIYAKKKMPKVTDDEEAGETSADQESSERPVKIARGLGVRAKRRGPGMA